MKDPYKDKEQDNSINVDAAWRRLTERMKEEPASPVWGPLAVQLDGEQRSAAIVHPVSESFARNSGRKRGTFRFALGFGITAAVTACLLIAIGFLTPMGDRAIAAMLQTFRIQHMVGLEITDADFSKIQQAFQSGTLDAQSFDLKQYGEVEVKGGGQGVQMTPAEAAKQLGRPVKQLPGADENGKLYVQPAFDVTLRLNVDKVNQMLTRLGGKTKFPAEADGQPISMKIPAFVQANLQGSAAAGGNKNNKAYKQLNQIRVPKLDVPQGIDVNRVRQAVLDLPILTDDMRRKLEGIIDWKNTFPVPSDQGESKNITVGGKEAVLHTIGGSRGIMWLDGDYVYRLSGSPEAYPSDDALIREAEAIIAQ
jgi:hypothetical protein